MRNEIKRRIEQINKGIVPEGYKRIDIGIVPDEWEYSTLGKIGEFFKGRGLPGNEMCDKGVPCCGYGDIYMKYNYYFEKAENFVDESIAKDSQPIKKGTLLFTGTGETAEEIGKCVCYNGNETIYAGGDIILFSTKINPLFVSYQQNIESSIKAKAKLAQGHSVVHIYADRIEKLAVAYPQEKIEQQRIVDILTKCNDAITLQENLIKKLEEQRKALIQCLLATKDDWEEVKIGSLVVEKTERNKIACENVMSVSNKLGFINQEEQFTKQVASVDKSNYKLVLKNYIAYNPSRINVGSIAIYTNDDMGIVSPMYVVFECKIIPPKLLLLILSTNKGKYDIENFLSGSVRNSLNFGDLCEIKIKLPPSDSQKEIIKIFDKIDKNIDLQKQKLEKLKKQQQILMQLLLTGIVRVKYE